MTTAIMHLSAWAEAQILTERMQMQCNVERDEQQENSGMTEAYYEELDKRATEQADFLIGSEKLVADASDYPMFFAHLTLALNADGNEERLRWLATIRDCVFDRIKSQAREDLRKYDLQVGNEDIPSE